MFPCSLVPFNILPMFPCSPNPWEALITVLKSSVAAKLPSRAKCYGFNTYPTFIKWKSRSRHPKWRDIRDIRDIDS